MTTRVTMYGASDDLVLIEGCTGSDEFENPKGEFVFTLTSDEYGEGLRLIASYVEPGVWVVGFGPIDEDADHEYAGHWVVSGDRTTHCPDYSGMLNLDCPDDVVVARV